MGALMKKSHKELLEISEELQIDFIKALEVSLIKIQDKRLGGEKAQEIISHSIIAAWVLWLKQITIMKRAELFEQGCHLAADKLLEISRIETYGERSDFNH
jgi:hypothetical protein